MKETESFIDVQDLQNDVLNNLVIALEISVKHFKWRKLITCHLLGFRKNIYCEIDWHGIEYLA